MGLPEIMFRRSPEGVDKALRQGEVLANVLELRLKLESPSSGKPDSIYEANPVKHPYAIIVSQDCDLEQDFNYRFGKKGNQRNELPSVVLCQAEDIDEFIKSDLYRSLFKSSTFEGNFKKNNEFRYHFIQEVPSKLSATDERVPELGIDFKRYFGMPTADIYHQIRLGQTQRSTVLESPYRDHFSQRFYNFNNRIALPEEYASI